MRCTAFIHQVSPVFLSDFTSIRRITTRPVEYQDAGFQDRFDDNTLFYDTFRLSNEDTIVALGPPLNNLYRMMSRAIISDVCTGKRLKFRIRNLDRQCQIHIKASHDISSINIKTHDGEFTISPQASQIHLFEGLRVLLTQSKDNQLVWIQDWAKFNRDVHGAQSLILYDNGSVIYDEEDLLEALKGITGLRVIGVVKWPFKFGPQGRGWADHWDSDFGQLGTIEHARWLYLSDAKSVMLSDIDELVVGDESVFAAAEKSIFGIVRYYGRWVCADQNYLNRPLSARRHRDLQRVLQVANERRRFGRWIDANRCNSKWTLAPKMCPRYAQWHTHRVKRLIASFMVSSRFSLRHFKPINTSWKYDRDSLDATAAQCRTDELLAAAMHKVNWNW